MLVYENIKYLIRKNGMKQDDLIQKLGITKTAFYSYVKGNPSLSTLEKLADALNTDIENIVTKKPIWMQNDDDNLIRKEPTRTTLICPHCGNPISIQAE